MFNKSFYVGNQMPYKPYLRWLSMTLSHDSFYGTNFDKKFPNLTRLDNVY